MLRAHVSLAQLRATKRTHLLVEEHYLLIALEHDLEQGAHCNTASFTSISIQSDFSCVPAMFHALTVLDEHDGDHGVHCHAAGHQRIHIDVHQEQRQQAQLRGTKAA
jgi:hypothetical protein